MNNESKTTIANQSKMSGDNLGEEGLSAKPKDDSPVASNDTDPDVVTRAMEYGEANLQDAKDSGYTDEKGHATSMAKKDVTGSPTGGYTDIGAGRSSAVRRHLDADKKTHH